MPSEERILFKDKITKKEYTVLAKELLNAVDMGEDALKKVLQMPVLQKRKIP